MSRSLLFALVVALLAVALLRPEGAAAHATLTASEPAQNDFLTRSPTRIVLTFSEPLEPSASGIQLLDALGRAVATGPSQVVDGSPTVMRLELEPLEPGIYNVLWFNVSTVDGHPLRGSFPFTVLNPDGTVPDVENTVGGTGGNDPQPLADAVAVRALALLGLVATAGAALLLLLVSRPPARAGNAFRWMATGGAAILATASALNLVLILDSYDQLSLAETLFDTRVGMGWCLGIAALVAAAVAVGPLRGRALAMPALLLAAAALYAFGFSITSHAAAGTGSAWAITFDYVHLTTGILWVGAVAGVVVLAREAGRGGPYAAFVPRFSLMASVLVYVIFVSGTLNAFVEIDSVDKLTDTRYGWTLLVKLALIAPLLAVGWWNAFRGRHRLVRGAAGEPRRFIFTAGLEVMLGIAVIATAAVLSQTTPSKTVVDTPEARPFDATMPAGALEVRLQIDPNKVGLNTYRVALTGGDGEPVEADRVRLTFRYQDDQTVGASTLDLGETGPGTYSGQGPYLTLQGNWRVEVNVRQPNVDDEIAFFDVRPAGPPVSYTATGGRWDNPAPGLSWNELAGFIVVAIGLAFVLWRDPVSRVGRWGSAVANVMTLAGFGVGTLLLFGVHGHSNQQGLPENPIFPDENSIAQGRLIYENNCQVCHGPNGVPPPGLDLDPYPLDLTVHVPNHPDGQIYNFIYSGIPGTAMIGWGETGVLTEEQIWHVVNYLRTLTLPTE